MGDAGDIAIVGLSAILPDAPDARRFWKNVVEGRYSIGDIPPGRWDPALYYDPDPSVPDKTYSKIGGWVRDFEWEPMKWHLPIPPKVSDAMDVSQRWAVACARAALLDYGHPERALDLDRCAVVIGTAMAGDKHYRTALRIFFPELATALAEAPSFSALADDVRSAIAGELHERIAERLPEINEDTMPGELANCMAGRIANLFDFHGPNFVCDAACASALAAIDAAFEGLAEGEYDAALVGGVDRNMGPAPFVKFSKIGALSATGTRPYADGADGFVMGEGAAFFLLKRLADAEAADDTIYAVIRGVAGSSDGKGKGITAPNPAGQRLAIDRAWRMAGIPPASVGLMEGHGTSTRVGDVVEVETLNAVFGGLGLPVGSVPLGSVKSNIGHLKGAAGAAGLLKTVFALHEKVLPPSLNAERPNPNIDFARSPFRVSGEAKPWDAPAGGVRRAGLSAFGFGGTNYHAVLEEYVPGRLMKRGTSVSIPDAVERATRDSGEQEVKAPLRGALVLGAATPAALRERLEAVVREASDGSAPAPEPPRESDLRAPERIAIDYGDAAELASRGERALKGMAAEQPAVWRALRAQGIFRGRGPAPKVAFLYTGQGSQYVNMLRELRAKEPEATATFAEADQVMTPLLDRPLSDFIFVDDGDAEALEQAEADLKRTEITQPAVLAVDMALTRLLAEYGVTPDLVMGHSLGEYGALVASGALSFRHALEAVSARGREMANLSLADNGRMAAVFAPLDEIERVLASVDGNVVVANVNSRSQGVIGGASNAVERAMAAFEQADVNAVPLPVSHAFHTSIVAPISDLLRTTLERLGLEAPSIPLVANVNGELYPTGPGAPAKMLDLLAAQVASPVEFVKGLEKLYELGARVFVEVGPKKALHGFVEDVLGDREGVMPLFTNHPKVGEAASLNQALCGLYASGLGVGTREAHTTAMPAAVASVAPAGTSAAAEALPEDRYVALGRLFAEFLERGSRIVQGASPAAPIEPPVVTGAAVGLPGGERVFDARNVQRILDGEQLIDLIPTRFRHAMVDKHITRLVKSGDEGPHFESIESSGEVIKLAARAGKLDLEQEYGVPGERVPAYDVLTELALAAGIEALHDAGIPLVMRYRTTTKGTQLPERWVLPEALRDDTGVIFASAFPGANSFAKEFRRYYTDHARREEIGTLRNLRARMGERANGDDVLRDEVDRRIHELEQSIESEPYEFDRRFLFRVLSMAHSQFAEYVGARGPNTQVNSACASTTQAFALAEDWIRAGRCRRVVVLAADDVTTDELIEWIGAGFLATGAAATDDAVEEAALPFDRRRHGMILGMGAAGFVIEDPACARERGLRPICEVLSTVTANSAFHGTRLDVDHICAVMEQVVSRAERRFGLDRRSLARELLFVSHETYTPARGGSAAAEVHALRRVFGDDADRVLVANTKGLTGHPMGVGIEDVVAVKALETGVVPPVPNYREADPELGALCLSKGGVYPIRYALRLSAGFGSQISMSLLRWVPTPDGRRPDADALGYATRICDTGAWRSWLARVSGDPDPQIEVVQQTLRVKDRGPGERAMAPSPPVESVREARPTPKPVAAPTPPAAAPVQESAPAGEDPVRARVLEIVAEKTGYPPDMLDLDLDLEADLGIDTVKQAETFAAIREAWDIPREESLKLRDYPTLAHAISFVHERRPDLAPPPAAAEATASAATREPDASPASESESAPAGEDPVRARVLEIVAEKTGYPPDMLDLDLDLEADLGIDTVKQAETFAAIREAWDIPREESLKLRDYPTLAHAISFVHERRPDLAPPPAAAEATASAATREPDASPASESESAPAGEDPVRARVLEIVAEKTGYPPDMLDLDLDLEADLGIDTVKQAETFAAIREAWDIPREESLKLRDYPTLAHAISFVHERRPDLVASDRSAGTATEPDESGGRDGESGESTAPSGLEPLRGDDEAARGIARRVPVAVLRPALADCVETGVELAAGSRVLVMPDQGGVANALVRRLEKRGVEVLILESCTEADDLTGRIREWLARGPAQGVFWLPALDDEGEHSTMEPSRWRALLARRVKLLYAAMRALYESLGVPGSFLVTATRLGGRHGYDEAGALAPMGGAVVGFAKTFKRERPDALVKAVDFGRSRKTAATADALLAETLRDPGAVEVGIQDERRFTISLVERNLADAESLSLGRDSVYVVTGAAGSIVSAIVADLARSGGTFHLLDVAPAPDLTNPDIAQFGSDRDALKRTLFERLRARGERGTPAQVERELAGIERAHAAAVALHAVRAAGGTAHYHAVDLTQADAVAKVIDRVREESGRIDVLLHAAGLERSRRLPDKNPAEFDLVFDVKCDGWFHLMRAIGDMPLSAVVVFSSIAGRFGNAGQSDYSAANDLLCKCISQLGAQRAGTRAVAIDWTAWRDIGMASRGSIPELMQRAGIDMIRARAGIPIVRRELTSGGAGGEVLVGGQLGVLEEEWHEQGGLDTAAFSARARGPMVGSIVRMGLRDGLCAETVLDPAEQPFLHDHQIEGIPVLPGVMGVEAFAELACVGFPDLHVRAVEEVEFLAPFKFYRGEPRALELRARFEAQGDEIVAFCELVGSRDLPGRSEPQVTRHFRARVRLGQPLPEEETAPPGDPGSHAVSADDVYRIYFHGPAYQVIESAWRSENAVVGRCAPDLPQNHHPGDLPLLTSPRLCELCFQTAGVREIGATGVLGLPHRIRRISLPGERPAAYTDLCAVVASEDTAGGIDACVVDAQGRVRLRLEGYVTVELPGSVEDEKRAPLRKALGG